MPRSPVVALAVAALTGAAGVAHAEAPPPAASWVGAPVLPAGAARVALVHELRLTTYFVLADELGLPWATSLDAAVALSPRLTLGLAHSARAQGTIDRGGGWCHVSSRHRCDGAYAGGLVDARWHVGAARGLTLAALGGVGVRDVGPVQPLVRLGLAARTARGRWWAAAEPQVQVALGHRELGNRDTLVAPVWLGLGRRRAAGWLVTGLRGQLVGFGETWEVPIVLGGAVALGRVRLGVEAGFPRLLGPQNTASVRHGAAWIAVEL